MKRGCRLILLICPALLLMATACRPPAFLREMVGKETPATTTEEQYPPPQAVEPPVQLLFGTVVLTNEPGWGKILPKGRESGGALVLDVLPNTPAQQLGVQPGDVISWIDGAEIQNHEQLLVAFRAGKTGQHEMRIVKADGTTKSVTAQLVPPGEFSLVRYLEERIASQPGPVVRYLLAEQLEDHNRAIDIVRALLQEHPELPEAHALLARRLLDRVQASAGDETTAQQSSNDLAEVAREIDTAVQLDPRAASIYRARAQINLTLGQPAKAESDAAAALRMDDLSAETYYLLGTARLALGRANESLAPLHLAVQLDPYVIDYYVSLALSYRALGREDDTRTTLEAGKALVTDPEVRQRIDELMNRPAA
ncbi:MAG: PDZ domain-containing protein [Actinomycetota bacterium]|nr:PDZ domain-containing protein [Actinomycetota bacterium]